MFTTTSFCEAGELELLGLGAELLDAAGLVLLPHADKTSNKLSVKAGTVIFDNFIRNLPF
ncbi:hypothetical protein GCM10008018_54110 [Paenibacillus marchantiophytorum]|uniref:Uncharacterized protein n=1 Tax=Paenibacillus marchantiophytorum TaxID=1619310 RepID=A0ABQ1F5Y0_9BACL|nr:hypothetical protein GCM10008018_54110 [Paenibacillus marchantiophytorum]